MRIHFLLGFAMIDEDEDEDRESIADPVLASMDKREPRLTRRSRSPGQRSGGRKIYVLQIKLKPRERSAVDAAARSAILPRATWARRILLQHAGFGGSAVADLATSRERGGAVPGGRRSTRAPGRASKRKRRSR